MAEWKALFARSRLRLRAGADPDAYANIVETLLDGVFIGAPRRSEPGAGSPVVQPPRWAAPGSTDARELEQAAAICGAALAAEGATGFDVGAIIYAVREVVNSRVDATASDGLAALFEWISLVALDAFGHATAMAAIERSAQEIEDGTPVFSVSADIAAVVWLGSPDTAAAEGIVGRLLLHLVRTGARAVVLDVTRLADAAVPAVVIAAKMLFSHRKVRGTVAVVVVDREPQESSLFSRAGAECELEVSVVDRFEAGVELAGRLLGSAAAARR